MITIHNFARGIRGVRVSWVCEEMQVPYRVERVAYPPSDAYTALNPLGTVPFLEDARGVAFGESVAMMLYVAQTYGPSPLLPSVVEPSYARMIHLTIFGETALGAAMNPLLASRFGAPEAEKRAWLVGATEARVERSIAYVADLLGDAEYLAGPVLTLADISVSTALGLWKGALGHELPAKLVAYRERLAQRPAYQRALAAHAV